MNEVRSIEEMNSGVKSELLRKANNFGWEGAEDKSIFEIAKLLLPFIDDERFGQAFDYLKCKIDHQRQVEKIKQSSHYHGEFEELLHELRHELRKGGQMILENIRFGKRSEEIDALLTKITMFEKLLSASRPNITISTDNPSRCSQCNKDCLSAYRILYGILMPIIDKVKNEQPK